MRPHAERGNEKFEQGEAERVDGVWWVYTTTQAAPGVARVLGVAEDLPGHIGQGVTQGMQEQEAT